AATRQPQPVRLVAKMNVLANLRTKTSPRRHTLDEVREITTLPKVVGCPTMIRIARVSPNRACQVVIGTVKPVPWVADESELEILAGGSRIKGEVPGNAYMPGLLLEKRAGDAGAP